MATSGTYNFQSVRVELLVREAFERIGVIGDFLDSLKIDSAIRSINILLLNWMDSTTNLWTLQNSFLPLVTGQAQYALPSNVLDIVQLNLRTSTRQLNSLTGLAQSNTTNTYDAAGGGVAANAFNDDPATACTQNVVNGNISYDFGITNPGPNQIINTEAITFVGIQSNDSATHTIFVESCPSDPTDLASWTTRTSLINQSFTTGQIVWFEIPTPVNARAYRIRAGGGSTLDIRKIYFNNNTFDFNISNVSRYEYNTYPNKFLQSRPSVYYLDRQIAPILNIWPTPAPQYNCIQYSYKRMMQDVNALTETIEIPAKMYPALIWGLCYHLALKFNLQLADSMEAKYQKSFYDAMKEDSEDTILSIRREDRY